MNSGMTMQKMAALLTRLLDKTDAGELEWESTASRSRFLTTFGKYSVAVEEFDGMYSIVLLDGEGHTLERATHRDLRTVDDNAYGNLQLLFEAARRRAFGVDKALDEMLELLD